MSVQVLIDRCWPLLVCATLITIALRSPHSSSRPISPDGKPRPPLTARCARSPRLRLPISAYTPCAFRANVKSWCHSTRASSTWYAGGAAHARAQYELLTSRTTTIRRTRACTAPMRVDAAHLSACVRLVTSSDRIAASSPLPCFQRSPLTLDAMDSIRFASSTASPRAPPRRLRHDCRRPALVLAVPQRVGPASRSGCGAIDYTFSCHTNPRAFQR
jgi:hypothetical protein